jgi:hypothetical protein
MNDPSAIPLRVPRLCLVGLASWWLLTTAAPAHAALLHGDALDTVANVISWFVIILAPLIGIAVFWLVHILPEKIAEKKRHPQTKAIQCLCLLSLVFGGLLWPLAWLWAYSKPVLYRMAYGTDVDESVGHHGAETPPAPATAPSAGTGAAGKPEPGPAPKSKGGKA